jgi:hypothetical protein
MCAAVSYYNTHSVYVKTGLATEDQLKSSTLAFRNIVASKFPEYASNLGIIVNYVRARGNPVGYSYLWVDSSEIFNILCGFNPDGSERIEETDPEEDMGDDFLSMNFSEIIESYRSKPRIMKRLPPILTLPSYRYNEEQKARAHEELIDEFRKSTGVEPTSDDIVVPEIGSFDCKRSKIIKINDPEINNSVIYSEIEGWITDKMIMDVFGRFNTSASKYPIITTEEHKEPTKKSRGIKKLYIEFSSQGSSSQDAAFALQITRKSTFSRNINGEKETVEHVFNLCKRSFHGRNEMNNTSPRNLGFATRALDTGFANRASGGNDDGFTKVNLRKRR